MLDEELPHVLGTRLTTKRMGKNKALAHHTSFVLKFSEVIEVTYIKGGYPGFHVCAGFEIYAHARPCWKYVSHTSTFQLRDKPW